MIEKNPELKIIITLLFIVLSYYNFLFIEEKSQKISFNNGEYLMNKSLGQILSKLLNQKAKFEKNINLIKKHFEKEKIDVIRNS